MIVFVLGKMGAGKTTCIRKFIESGECEHIEFDWRKHNLRQRKAHKKEAYSTWIVGGKRVAAVGSYHKPSPNKLGGDTFLFEVKEALGKFLLDLNEMHDLVLYDGTSISPTVLEMIESHCTVLYLDTPTEKCVESRIRRMQRPALVTEDDVLKLHDKTEKQRDFLQTRVPLLTVTRKTFHKTLEKL